MPVSTFADYLVQRGSGTGYKLRLINNSYLLLKY